MGHVLNVVIGHIQYVQWRDSQVMYGITIHFSRKIVKLLFLLAVVQLCAEHATIS